MGYEVFCLFLLQDKLHPVHLFRNQGWESLGIELFQELNLVFLRLIRVSHFRLSRYSFSNFSPLRHQPITHLFLSNLDFYEKEIPQLAARHPYIL